MVLIAVVVAFTVAAFRANPDVSPAMRLAVRFGFAALLASMAFGGVMIARGMVEVLTGDPRVAYALAGSLKPAHAVLMHGVLLLPALAWALGDLRVVRLACWFYVGFAALVSGLAVAGITVVGPAAASVLAAGAVTGLGLAAAVAGRFLRRPGSPPRPDPTGPRGAGPAPARRPGSP
ncbi:hypothetical protein OIE66_02520 [Nonomuraea sp. NBC_01738]|uniref:hypothetical protein n=1 Tax=Nonomuraea sp. NBC_01738 TaxID=2976003 RepID=UPI002E13EED8|nr:hypothetical protein OIE66_02520 [Nonomuraea sp. NBC_01738]